VIQNGCLDLTALLRSNIVSVVIFLISRYSAEMPMLAFPLNENRGHSRELGSNL